MYNTTVLTIEQVNLLKEHGIIIKNAELYQNAHTYENWDNYVLTSVCSGDIDNRNGIIYDIPTLTVANIFTLLPNNIVLNKAFNNSYSITYNGEKFISNSILDVLFKTLLWCLEHEFIENKELKL